MLNNFEFTFYIQPPALISLTHTILSLVILIYLKMLKKKSDSTGLLVKFFFFNTLFIFTYFIFDATISPVRAWSIPIQFLFFLCTMVYWHRFSYSYPRPLMKQRFEQRVVNWFSLGGVLAGLVYTLYFFHVLSRGMLQSPPPLLYMSLLVAIQIFWSMWVFVRRTVLFSEKMEGRLLTTFFKANTKESRSLRAFTLLFLIPIFTVFMLMLRDTGIVSAAIGNFILTVSIPLFFLIFTVVYLNYSREPGSFMVKWVGASLVLVLVLLGAISYLAYPYWNNSYIGPKLPEKNEGILFHPYSGGDGYSIDIVSGGFDADFASHPKLPFSNRNNQTLKLDFPFPYAGRSWTELIIHTNGLVTFGTPSFSSAVITNMQPAIAPLWNAMKLDTESGIFYQNAPGKATITWANLPDLSSRKRVTFQLTLFASGNIQFDYLEIEGSRPRLIGVLAGNGYTHIHETHFSDNLPVNVPSATIVENFYKDFRAYIHDRMMPITIIVIISSLLVVLLFPPFFRINLQRPMESLLVGLKKVEDGDLSISLPVQFNDEIGRLTGSFNHMVRSMKEAKDGWSHANVIKDQLLALNDAILDTAADGIITVNMKGLILSFNKAAEDMFGYSCEEMVGKPCYILLEDEKKENGKPLGFVDHYQSAGKQKRFGVEYEFKGKRKDGSTFPLEFAVSATEPSGGRIFTVILRDLTEHLRLAQEKLKLEEQLHQSQKLETIGTLAGGVAHDFNNILTPIIGYAEMALDDIPGETVTRGYMENILKSCNRARDLVRQILTFSRKNPAVFELVDMLKLVKGGLSLIRASTPSTISFHLDLSVTTCTVFGDRTQLEQVLINLCTNATHAMIPGGGNLYITLQQVLVDEALASRSPALKQELYVMLKVKDTGIGMDKDTLDHIFDPYFTTKPVGQGTGLGLSVVHGIVDKHGGAIFVDSEPGKGSEFSVYFPAITAQEIEKEIVEEEIKKGNESILLVDDEDLITDMYREALERTGYRVTAFTDSLKTLEVFRAEPDGFDLIITDNTMPYLTGVQLSEEVRKLRPDIPIILFTGNSNLISEKVCQQLGIGKVLAKPVFFRNLNVAIRELLHEREVQELES